MYSIRDIILVGAIAISLPICFVRPFFGILLWTIFAFLNPHEFAWGAARQLPLAQAVAISALAGALIFKPSWKQLFCRDMALVAILWFWFTITSINSSHEPLFANHAADTWARWEMVSKVLLMTFTTVVVVNSRERLRWFLLTIAGSFGVIVLKSLPFIILSDGRARIFGPPHSMIADNNDLGLALNMTLPFFFFLAKAESRPWMKRLLALLFSVTIPAIMFTYSRGAFLGLAAVLGCMILQTKQKAILIPVAAFLGLFALMLVPQAWRDRISTTSNFEVDASAQSRFNSWTYSWRLAEDFPLMGGGFDMFVPELFDRYAPNRVDVHGPHSIYFGVLAEHGFTGLFLYLCLVVSSYMTARKAIRLARSIDDEQTVMYANIFRFALVGFLVSGAFLGRAYFDYFFTIVAGLAILKCDIKARCEEAFDSDPESPVIEEPERGFHEVAVQS